MNILYVDLIPELEREAFKKRLLVIANALSVHPNWLMQVFHAESRVNPAARNTFAPFFKNGILDGYATGLIQFIPDTARALKTTTKALEAMTATKQLDYVFAYLKPWRTKLKSYYDVYLVVFFPAAIGKPDDYVFETSRISRGSIARSNPAINIDKDEKITMAEFKQYLRKTVPQNLWPQVFDVVFERP